VADINFKIASGPYAGDYGIDLRDVTASDVGDLLNAGGPDLDAMFSGGGSPGTRVIAGLVWVVRRRGNKGLAYRAVADHISMDVIEPATEAPVGDDSSGLPDPSSSDAG
jgi:hypothetical protein